MDHYRQHPAATGAFLTAEQDVDSDIKKGHWFFIGFCGNILGILIASVYQPTPPASRLLEKAPEYVALYTDSYKAKSRSVQIRQSALGLVVAFGLGILLAIITS